MKFSKLNKSKIHPLKCRGMTAPIAPLLMRALVKVELAEKPSAIKNPHVSRNRILYKFS